MSETRDTSHSPIGPCGTLEQPPRGHSLRYSSTALLSSVLECGENAGMGVHVICDIDPDDRVNIECLLAFERNKAAPQIFRLNDVTSENIKSMLSTLDTSHCEMSPLNNFAEENMQLVSVMLDTSHLEISPLNSTALRNI